MMIFLDFPVYQLFDEWHHLLQFTVNHTLHQLLLFRQKLQVLHYKPVGSPLLICFFCHRWSLVHSDGAKLRRLKVSTLEEIFQKRRIGLLFSSKKQEIRLNGLISCEVIVFRGTVRG